MAAFFILYIILDKKISTFIINHLIYFSEDKQGLYYMWYTSNCVAFLDVKLLSRALNQP